MEENCFVIDVQDYAGFFLLEGEDEEGRYIHVRMGTPQSFQQVTQGPAREGRVQILIRPLGYHIHLPGAVIDGAARIVRFQIV